MRAHEQHQRNALRAVRARALRRRARQGLALAAAALAPIFLGGRPWANARGGRGRRQVAALAPANALARHPAGANRVPRVAPAPDLLSARQLTAVRRLARYGRPLYCGGRGRRWVALTFDDGPGVYTSLAVRKLRKYHLVATFFLVGKAIRAWPGLVDEEKPLAVFGDHTMTHPFLPALPKRSWSGIERNVIAGLRPGSIILMHENRGQTIRALPTIFRAIRRQHLQAVTVPELVAEDPPSLTQLHAGVGGCSVLRGSGNGS